MAGETSAAAAAQPPRRSLTDDLGRPLCHAALWGHECPRLSRAGECEYSHAVPEALRSEYEELRKTHDQRRAALRASQSDRRALHKASPPKPAAVTERVERLRAERILVYEPSAHRLGELVAALLECAPGEELHEVHMRPVLPQQPPLCPTLQHAYKLGGRKLPGSWRAVMGPGRNRRVIEKLLASEAYRQWLEGYDAWVRAVVLPAIGEAFYYQRPPTLRVAMPSRAATIGLHRDADYHGHHPAEINVWCPLVAVADSSALWLESTPGRGDFEPRALEVGQCLVFNGYLCRHFTRPNQSGRTRVSFDLRCIPVSALEPGAEPPAMIGDYACALMRLKDPTCDGASCFPDGRSLGPDGQRWRSSPVT